MRKDPEVTISFQKDRESEQFLQKLNDILAPSQEAEYEDLPEKYPTLHIIGAPRSGTTLLYQLLTSHLQVGFINNLIASFWKAPVYGIRLSQKLMASYIPSSYVSGFKIGFTRDLIN